MIRQQLLTIISSRYDTVAHDLSPHWFAESSGRFRLLCSLPVWLSLVFLSFLLLIFFVLYKIQIVNTDNTLQQRIASIGNVTPPLAVNKVLRLKNFLKDEIARGVVSVEENAHQSRVTFLGDFMLVLEQKNVNPKIIPVLDKVASEINKVSGTVTITGHTDN